MLTSDRKLLVDWKRRLSAAGFAWATAVTSSHRTNRWPRVDDGQQPANWRHSAATRKYRESSHPAACVKPRYDPVKDLDPIASVAANCLCIAVNSAVPVQTLRSARPLFTELIDH